MFCSGIWVKKILRRLAGREQGQAMLMALLVLTVGALLITPVLSYGSTGVKAAAIYKRLTAELYAADAGVEYTMWQLQKGLLEEILQEVPFGSSIALAPITVGNLPVTRSVKLLTEMLPVIINTASHYDWLQVSSDTVDNGGGSLTFTVTAARGPESNPKNMKIVEIGAWLPENFSYVSGSTSGDITTANPSSIIGNNIIWTINKYLLEQPAHHSFLVQGSGVFGASYSWVKILSSDIGAVYSCYGYNIVSIANDGTTIEANVVTNGGAIYPVSWEVN
jgi:hypothetical protein